MTRRVIFYSGGALSWAAAQRTIETHGRECVTLLFTDTLKEHPDLYRFMEDSVRQLGVSLVHLKDGAGRSVWDVYRDERMIGNTRFDPCSKILKRQPAQKWLRENAPDATLVFGIDWTEMHRLGALRKRYGDQGHPVEAPMCDAPWRSKGDVFEMMRGVGLEPSSSYADGFAHDNCGGFCCRAGQGHFAHLLRVRPGVYAEHEGEEQKLRAYLGKDVAILRDRTGGRTRPMTLREFRERIEAGAKHDETEIGGCGCFVEA